MKEMLAKGEMGYCKGRLVLAEAYEFMKIGFKIH